MSQNYANHRRLVPMYHYVSTLLALAILIGSIVNLVDAMGTAGLYSASLLVANAVLAIAILLFTRIFALKAQDRAINAEENLRNYARHGELLDPRLTIRQIIGLRFAADDEYDELAKRALSENLSETDIKKAIEHWRPDTYRA